MALVSGRCFGGPSREQLCLKRNAQSRLSAGQYRPRLLFDRCDLRPRRVATLVCGCARRLPRTAASALDCDADDGCLDEGAVTVRDDLDSLLSILPGNLRALLSAHPRRSELVEVVLDLGRSPEMRGANGYREVLRAEEITAAELEAAAGAIGSGNFGGDNRAGIEGA